MRDSAPDGVGVMRLDASCVYSAPSLRRTWYPIETLGRRDDSSRAAP